MQIRIAETAGAKPMSQILRAIIAATGQDRPGEVDFVLSTYINHPASIRCSVAVAEVGRALGFQSLIRALPGNPYGVDKSRRIIGTHISPLAHRRWGQDGGPAAYQRQGLRSVVNGSARLTTSNLAPAPAQWAAAPLRHRCAPAIRAVVLNEGRRREDQRQRS